MYFGLKFMRNFFCCFVVGLWEFVDFVVGYFFFCNWEMILIVWVNV